MAVQVPEQMVIVLPGGGVPVPLLDIEREKCLIDVLPRLVLNALEMCLKVFDQVLVEVFAEKMRATTVISRVERGTSDSFLSGTEVVDSGVKSHVRLHVHAPAEVGHDLVNTGFEVLPSVR
jgi:hypothetical protein